MKKDLVFEKKTEIAQKFPEDLKDKITNFHTYVILLNK